MLRDEINQETVNRLGVCVAAHVQPLPIIAAYHSVATAKVKQRLARAGRLCGLVPGALSGALKPSGRPVRQAGTEEPAPRSCYSQPLTSKAARQYSARSTISPPERHRCDFIKTPSMNT